MVRPSLLQQSDFSPSSNGFVSQFTFTASSPPPPRVIPLGWLVFSYDCIRLPEVI